MASDEDSIFVDVVAKLDESAANKAAGQLKDHFKGAGQHIGDALGSELGQVFTRNLGDALRGPAENLAKEAGTRLGRALG